MGHKVYETHEVELVTWLHGYKISQRYVENSEFYVLTKNLPLNNTFWISHYSNMIFDKKNPRSGPWISMSLRLVWTPKCASLQRIVVLSTRKLVLSLLRLRHPLFSEQIILQDFYFLFCVPEGLKSPERNGKYWKSAARTLFFHIWSFLVNASL